MVSSSFTLPPTPEVSDGEDMGSISVRVPTAEKSHAMPDAPEAPSDDAVLYERKLGDSELSYYLPSRATGVNDMYLHLGFRAPERFLRRARVRAVWALLRLRHPLLAAQVAMHGYDDIRFAFTPPKAPEDALLLADRELEYKAQSKEDLIDAYLNGPRTLSGERLSYLVVSRPPTADDALLPTPPPTPTLPGRRVERVAQYELLICAAHFIGDGMALHQFANDFFCLLASERSQEELDQLVREEWQQRWGARQLHGSDAGSARSCTLNDRSIHRAPMQTPPLPSCLEESLPKELSNFRRIVGKVDFQNNQASQIGGHRFPRRADPVRHTVVPTVPFDEATTKAILKKCKAHGVSIASALFAVCNFAWARMSSREQHKLPMMMYAALNVRPYFVPRPLHDSYWFLAVGYFNVVLPSFISGSCDAEKTFWLRARAAKEQSAKAARNRMVVSRIREMTVKRGRQARGWAREDDEKARGTWVPPPPAPAQDASAAPKLPSAALVGLSLLGNLDGIYKHASFLDIELHTLTTGSRQRHGGMLFFGYTFAGKLWVSLGYDENGFDRKTVTVFWANVLGAINELLL